MNRRMFMLGMCAACSGTAKRPSTPSSSPNGTPPGSSDTGVRDMTLYQSQTRVSPLAFHGDTLVQSVDGELRAWNTLTMERTHTWALPHRHFCFTPDGALIALGFAASGPGTVIHRIDAAGGGDMVLSLEGPILPRSANLLLAGRTSGELFVSAGDNIYVLREHGKSFEVATFFEHPDPTASNRDQIVGIGDGRIVALLNGGGVRRIAVAPESTAAYPAPDGRRILHLAPGTRDRIWYSFATIAEDWNAHTLVLARLGEGDAPLSDDRTVDVAPGRIVHLAAHGAAAAALVLTLGTTKATWSVVVIDESGKERWRADVPDGASAHGTLDDSFIAIGDRRVVLASHGDKLMAWDAANGGPVT